MTKIITAGYLFEISPLSLSHLKLAWSLVDPLHAQRVEALNLPAESPRRRSVEDKDDQHYCKLNQTEFEQSTYIQTSFSPNFTSKLRNLPKQKL